MPEDLKSTSLEQPDSSNHTVLLIGVGNVTSFLLLNGQEMQNKKQTKNTIESTRNKTCIFPDDLLNFQIKSIRFIVLNKILGDDEIELVSVAKCLGTRLNA